MLGSCRSAAQPLICLAANQTCMCICILELGYDPASQLVHSLCRQVRSVSVSRQENPCGWDAKNNECLFMPWVTWALDGHSLAFEGLRRLCPWWHAIYDLVNPFLIILLWQRWKYPTSNDWLYWYAAICASVEEQSHKSNKLEKPPFLIRERGTFWLGARDLVQRHFSSTKGLPVICGEQPFPTNQAHLWCTPLLGCTLPSEPSQAQWSLGTEEEFLPAFMDIGLTAVKLLWLCGCSYWLVIYHICTERMIRKCILGQKKGFESTINWCCWRWAGWGQNGSVYLQTRMTGFHHRERNKIHLMNPDESKYDIVYFFLSVNSYP